MERSFHRRPSSSTRGTGYFLVMMTNSLRQREQEMPFRKIVHRTRGRGGGPITRLMSPSDLAALVKPFVFLDHAVFEGDEEPMPMPFGWHPHSGIATVTVV